MKLENAVPILYKSFSRYRQAHDFWYIPINGKDITFTQFQLYAGMEHILEREGLVSGLEDMLNIITNINRHTELMAIENRVKQEIMLAAEEYNKKVGLFPEDKSYLQPSEEMMEYWLRGKTLTAKDWNIYQALGIYAYKIGLGQLLFPKWFKPEIDPDKPRWESFILWKRGESEVYRFWNNIRSYHAQFTRVMLENGITVKTENEGGGSDSISEQRPNAESGFAKEIRSLIWKIGVKQNNRIAVVVGEQPKIREGRPKLDANLETVTRDNRTIIEEYPGQLINENTNLMIAIITAARDYISGNYKQIKGYGWSFKLDQEIAVWKFILDMIPDDYSSQVNFEYNQLLKRGYGGDYLQVNQLYKMLVQAKKEHDLDSYLLDAYRKRGLYHFIQESIISADLKISRALSYKGYIENFPTIESAFQRIYDIQPAIPARTGELLSKIYSLEIAERLAKQKISGSGLRVLEQFAMTGQERSMLKVQISELSNELSRAYGGGNIVMN